MMVNIKLLKSQLAIAQRVELSRSSQVRHDTGLHPGLGGCSVASLRAVGYIPKASLGPHTQNVTHSFILLKKKMFWKRRGGGSCSPSKEKY